jgi:glycine cleavage system H protein
MSQIPSDLKYTASHEWVRREADSTLTIGITDHAQEALGDLVFVELPEVGRALEAGEVCTVVESVKAASDVYAPVAGTVIAQNEAVKNSPELINQNAYDSWLFRLHPADSNALDALLDAAAYAKEIG